MDWMFSTCREGKWFSDSDVANDTLTYVDKKVNQVIAHKVKWFRVTLMTLLGVLLSTLNDKLFPVKL